MGVVLRGSQGLELVAAPAEHAAPNELAAAARGWSSRLIGEQVIYFPIRHHSPACAWHLEKLIAERKPARVLIEGPSSFDEYRELLASDEAQPPLAFYSYCNRREGDDPDNPNAERGPPRRGAYYPFSDYSPEWVALRAAQRSGAEVRFIDLTFAAQTLVDKSERLGGRVATLLAEHWFRRSEYLRRLAAALGCRDVDELWDRLFESWARELPTEDFVAQVATYCDLARRDATAEEHERDGTTAREAEMAWQIAAALRDKTDGPTLVVTGGYHSVVLPDLVAAAPERPKIDTRGIKEQGTTLIRYSFDRLDRANGYGAGMPAPAFYQRVWQAGERVAAVALELLAEISHTARDRGLDGAPTTVAVMAALEQALRLAELRGNLGPTRADLLDAIESCYLQGASLADGRPVPTLVRTLFTGTAVGSVPAAAGLPPIVADFYAQAKACNLKANDTETRQLALDVYSDGRARAVSRLLHRLAFLEVPFAVRLAGPSFTAHHVGRRLRELWQYGWSPQTESGLVDAAAYGSTVAEAATQRFADALKQLTDDGGARSARVAAEKLALACLLGLHDVVPKLKQWLSGCVREDPAFDSVTDAVHELAMLWQAREPLDAQGLEDLPVLARAAFERCAYLAAELGATPADRAHAAAGALVSLREVLAGGVAEWFDPSLLWSAVETLARQPTGEASVLGAAAGMLYSSGRVDDSDLRKLLMGRMLAAGPAGGVTYLRGVLLAAREVAWQSPAVLAALRALIEESDQQAFVKALPELRLALSVLTPAETDRVAHVVAGALGVAALGPAVEYAMQADEVQRNLELSIALREALARDGLEPWLAAEVKS